MSCTKLMPFLYMYFPNAFRVFEQKFHPHLCRTVFYLCMQFISARNKSQCIFNSYNFGGAWQSLFFLAASFSFRQGHLQTFHAMLRYQGEINIPPIRHKMKFF